MIINFRIYSRAIKGGGAVIESTGAGGGVVKSTSSGGGSTATSSSGGGTTTSTAAGGGTSKSTNSGGSSATTSGQSNGWEVSLLPILSSKPLGTRPLEDHVHSTTIDLADFDHTHTVNVPSHSHTFSTPEHTHSVSTPNHTHKVDIPNHTHEIDIPSHKHSVDIPEHSHEIEHGIFKLGTKPSRVTIKVDGQTIPYTATSADSLDLVPYLRRDSNDRIVRGWHEVEITPNGLGRIHTQLMSQFFIQSRGGVDA